MHNKDALRFFEKMTVKAKDNPWCVKMANNTDFTHIDAQFIQRYADKNTEILDLGSGTGLIVNKIYDKVKSIDCVEPFKEFSDHIIRNKNVNVINSDIVKLDIHKKYDLVCLFGVIQYFNEEESIKIYKKCLTWMNPNSKIIIKNQFGINEDVTVAGYSEEQKNDYFAQYRHIDKEIEILKNIGYKNIDVVDIYPLEANRWKNTHFYAIVAKN